MKKITQDEANIRVFKKCVERKYSIINEFNYIGKDKTYITLECNNCKHIWEISYNNLINRNRGCAKCSRVYSPTQTEAINIVKIKCDNLNYTLIENFVYKNGRSTKINLKCNIDNHEWISSYENFITGNHGCRKCADNNISETRSLSYEEAELKILKQCENKKIILNSPLIYNGSIKSKVELKCLTCETRWISSYQSIVYNNTGCPSCSVNGYNASKPGYFYIHKLNDEIYKFGITSNPEKRFSQQLRTSIYKIEKFKLYYSENGNIPKYIESQLKQKYKTGIVNKEDFSSGYTETFSNLILDEIIDYINLFMEENNSLIEMVI